MTTAWSLRRWSSPTDSSRSAAELLLSDRTGKALPIALARVAPELRDTSFLVVPIDDLPRISVHAAIEAFCQSGCRARLCLAGRRPTLQDILSTSLDDDRVGLMLQEVSELTPPSELIWDRIEAVRFGADFIERATRDMRLGFVLESMLDLARDLGLCTLGSSAVAGGGRVSGRFEFDFLPPPSHASHLATPGCSTIAKSQDIAIHPGR